MATKWEQMEEQVKKELEHIPKGPPVSQGMLRAAYQLRRMHSLGSKASSKQTAKEVLKECIDSLKKDRPDFSFEYDREFFDS